MGDGTWYPPSPLLFDPSLTLEDHSVKETAEGPVDILGQRWMARDGCRSQRSQVLKKPLDYCLKVECLPQMGSQNPLLSVDNLLWEPYDFGGFEFSILSTSIYDYLSLKDNSDHVV